MPARYGGFETLAHQLAVHIPPDQIRLVIFAQKSAYEASERTGNFQGHEVVYLPIRANGPASMVHDASALMSAVFVHKVSLCVLLGYSGAWALPLIRLLRPGVRIVSNIDGMEWRREKFGPLTRSLLKLLEQVSVKFSNQVIADNAAIAEMVRARYGIAPIQIAYGGDHVLCSELPESHEATTSGGYCLAIARVEPENNCDMIIDACVLSRRPLVFVGNWAASEYGTSIRRRAQGTSAIKLLDPVYDQQELARIRKGASVYIHGHSVGGSNPSLIEAIHHSTRILAYDCAFNRATLFGAGAYFSSVAELSGLLKGNPAAGTLGMDEIRFLRSTYTWSSIAKSYVSVMEH